MGDLFLSIDIGTSSIRAVLFDTDGVPRHSESVECSLTATGDGRAEVDPELVFESVLAVTGKCVRESGVQRSCIAGIGMSCHMHSLMLVDGKGRPMTGLMTWADTRAAAEADYIARSFDIGDLYKRTGCRVQHPMYPLSKVLWFKRNEPELFRAAHRFITIKEYIIYRLYGSFAVDRTLASCQGFYNINLQKWDEDIIHDLLGITEDNLSEVVECTHVLKGFRPEFETPLGLSKDTPLVMGSGDGIMANIGCGVYDSTSLSSTIGTSGAIRTAVDRPLLDKHQRTWCYSFTKDMWVAGGAINNGGLVLKWIREEFRKQFEFDAREYGESIYKLFDRFASQVSPGSDGLVFLPYLTGERSPDWNANARGIMFGLGYSHTRKHIIRAAMEGVMYRMYSVFEVMAALEDGAQHIRANGGYARSDLWLQMQADIFNKEITVSKVEEASALGAAFISMVSLGAVKSIREPLPAMQPQKAIKPIEENHRIYRKAYELSKQIYSSLYPGIQ